MFIKQNGSEKEVFFLTVLGEIVICIIMLALFLITISYLPESKEVNVMVFLIQISLPL